MGILDRLRGKEARSKSKLRFRSKEREASAKAKAKKDIRRAKAAARKKAAEARARAPGAAREVSRKTEEVLREVGEGQGRTAGNVEAPETTEEVFRLAGESAQLRSPVDATLDPSPDGPMNEALATGMGFSSASGEESSDDGGALMDPGFVTGESEPFHDSNGTGDDEDVEENPLEFSDDFFGGGSW